MKKPVFTRWLWLLFPAAICGLLAARLYLSPVALMPAEFFSEPPAKAEEDVQAAPQAARRVSDGAVSIRVDGATALTLHSAEDALKLLEWTLGRAQAPQGEALISASFARGVELTEAEPEETAVTLEQAERMLEENPGLCPVRVVSRAVSRTAMPYAAQTTQDTRLVKGARMVVRAGRAGEQITFTDTYAVNGTVERALSAHAFIPAVDEMIAIGTYASDAPEPGPDAGEQGPPAPAGFSLGAACAAEVVSTFGMYAGNMSYGIDYGCEVGDDVTAPEAGEVIFARARGSYGFLVEIDHGGGFVTRLSPVAQCALSPGMRVVKGQKIGVLDVPFDEDDAPCLHMELLIDGIPYNPGRYMDEAAQAEVE